MGGFASFIAPIISQVASGLGGGAGGGGGGGVQYVSPQESSAPEKTTSSAPDISPSSTASSVPDTAARRKSSRLRKASSLISLGDSTAPTILGE